MGIFLLFLLSRESPTIHSFRRASRRLTSGCKRLFRSTVFMTSLVSDQLDAYDYAADSAEVRVYTEVQ